MLNKAVSGHQHHDTLLGERGTQLTMRTCHIGGTASRVSQQSSLDVKNHGTVCFLNMLAVRAKSGDLVAMNRSGAIAVLDERSGWSFSPCYGANCWFGKNS